MSSPAGDARALVLSPHLDDAALSLGGRIAALAASGARPLVLTVFTAAPPPDAPLNALARLLHEDWGAPRLTVAAIWEARREEERAALSAMGAVGRTLDELDAVYRGERYGTPETLRGPLQSDDHGLIDRIATEARADLARLGPAATLYCPLAVGLHVDHQLCHLVGRRLEPDGVRVLYYEDFPYVLEDGTLAARLAMLPAMEPHVAEIPLERRLEAIGKYSSQLPVLFRNHGPWRDATGGYAARLSEQPGRFAERFWSSAPAP